jgi:hypothetical protein
MKASLKERYSGSLIGVVLNNGALILKTLTPRNLTDNYPTHIITEAVGLTSGNLDYWLGQPGSVGVYKGDTVTLQF